MTPRIKERKVHPWYDFNPVLSRNCTYNFIVGARGFGKTYGMQKRVIQRNVDTGEMFVWLRRYKDETVTTKNTFFAAVGTEFPDWDFRVTGWLAERAPMSTREQKKREWLPMGYFIPLSIAQSMKGVSFHLVTTIVFDEFIIEKGFTRYIEDEATAFNNFYSTVDRNQDRTKAYFLANSVSITNPYFLRYDIRPDQLPELSTRGDGFMLIHFPNSADFRQSVAQTKFGKFIAGTEYEEYAVGNQFRDANDALVKAKPSEAKPLYNLETKHGKFSVWYDRRSGEYYIQEKLIKNNRPIYTMLSDRMAQGKIMLRYNDKLIAYLRAAWGRGNVLFDGPRARNAFIYIFDR